MMACHAVVQRMLWEGLGLLPSPAGAQIQPPVMQPAAKLDLAVAFADDGVLAGPSGEVLRSLRHLKQIMPKLGLRFSSLIVAPAAGFASRAPLQAFVDEGCTVEPSGNLEILKYWKLNMVKC